MYGSPTGTYIHPRGTVVPQGTFVVTSTFAEHVASGRGPGVDIGNAKCGDPLYAMEAGKVVLAGWISTAKVVRVQHANGDVSGYAHLNAIEVALGQTVSRGQRIGTLGTTGATACHLHLGLKRGGVEIDSWPLLDQNSGGDMVPIPGASFAHLVNKKTVTIGVANFRAERLTTAPILKPFPAGTAFLPVVAASDGSAAGGPTPTRWYGGFLYAGSGNVFGWFHSSVVATLADTTPPADCSAQVKAATAPLTTALNTANQKITTAKNALA